MSLPVDLDLRDDRLDVVGLHDHRVPLELHREALERAARLRAPLADLVVGHKQDRVRRRLAVATQDQSGEVTPRKGTRLAVVYRDALEGPGLVDPGEAEESRDQVRVARQGV